MLSRRVRSGGIGGTESTSGTVVSPESGSKGWHTKKSNKANKDDSILPLWLVIVLCVSFVLIGYIHHHYTNQKKHATSHKHHQQHHHIMEQHKGHSTDSHQKPIDHHDKKKGGGVTGFGNQAPPKRRVNMIDPELKKSLLTPDQDAALEIDPITNLRYHVIFSTDCSTYQHWQSYLVFYSAMKVKQTGHVTRIVSGCDPEEEIAMNEWFTQDVQFMSPKRFHILLTPKFSTVRNDAGEIIGDYKFFNKPYGLKYFLENDPILQYDNSTKTFPDDISTKDVIILIDPDMGLIKPLSADFSNTKDNIISLKRQEHGIGGKAEESLIVRPGSPFAQTYGFGTQWQRLDLAKITGDPNSPALSVSKDDGRLYYPVGPPYLATVGDMHNIAVHWSQFVPATYEQYPHLLAEMFAFCIAAAHVQLPHTLIDSLMVSDVDAKGEGWSLIDQITPDEKVCEFAYHNPNPSIHPLPVVFHMCQRYMVGDEWFFSKRKLPGDVYDCEVPLFQIPPSDLATVTYKQFPGGKKGSSSKIEAKRNAFAICFIYGLLNDAATFYKQNSCQPNTINLQNTRSLAKYAKGQEDLSKLLLKVS